MTRLSINYQAAKLLNYVNCTHNVPFDNPEGSVFQLDPEDTIAFTDYFEESIATLGINAAMLRFIELCLEQ